LLSRTIILVGRAATPDCAAPASAEAARPTATHDAAKIASRGLRIDADRNDLKLLALALMTPPIPSRRALTSAPRSDRPTVPDRRPVVAGKPLGFAGPPGQGGRARVVPSGSRTGGLSCAHGHPYGDAVIRMAMLSFRVGDAEADELRRWAAALGVQRSELLRVALHRQLVSLRAADDAAKWQRLPATDAEQALGEAADWAPAEGWGDWNDAAG
jgi:hypothetical protein